MLRSDVCQTFIDFFADSSYLEVGVNHGTTFHAVRAARKVAVDPVFLFDVEAARAANAECAYHAMTSDRYFQSIGRSERYAVIYLDGMHTFEQTLRDLLNAIAFLHDDGVIVIDDVKPTSYAASLKSIPAADLVKSLTGDPDRSWMGDVYKLVWFIDSFLQQWSYRTVAENHGQVVMWRDARREDQIPHRLVEDVGSLSFERMATESEVFRITPMSGIVEAYRAARAAG